MSLTTALNIAQSALFATSKRTSVVSQNITNANNPDYSRRTAVLTSTAPGVHVAQIQRAASEVLFRQNLTALSGWSAQSARMEGLDTLHLQINGVDDQSSPAVALGNLQNALQLFSSQPSNASLAENSLDAARQMVSSLNAGSKAIQTFRAQTDTQIANAVSDLNGLLAEFGEANKAVIAATSAGRDASDALDQRDALLKKIAAIVPVTTATRANFDMMLTTADGLTLFETIPRAVSFQPTGIYMPGTTGNTVYIDGVPVRADSRDVASGSLSSLLGLRDQTATQAQNQLDEIARGLVMAFAESDAAGVLPDRTGLFAWSGSPALPPAALTSGLAASISLAPQADPAQGGSMTLVRDGGINGAAYVRNPDGAASFSSWLQTLTDRFDADMAFDASAGIGASGSLKEFSSRSISWLEGLRKSASTAVENRSAMLVRTSSALSNATGVNVDEQLSLMLELEHSYEASARIIRAVDEMLASLLAMVR